MRHNSEGKEQVKAKKKQKRNDLDVKYEGE